MTLWAALAAALLIGGLLAMFRLTYVFVQVRGNSMVPRFHDGDLILLRRAPGFRVRPGDNVVVRGPASTAASGNTMRPEFFLKRAVAVAGDPVPQAIRARVGTNVRQVPPNTYVVLGEDSGSEDSRTWGFVPHERTVGIVRGRVMSRRK